MGQKEKIMQKVGNSMWKLQPFGHLPNAGEEVREYFAMMLESQRVYECFLLMYF